MAQRGKRLLAMWETWVRSLGREDPLEKEMATHSGILAWRIPWMEEPGGLQSTGLQRVGHDWVSNLTWLDREAKTWIIIITTLIACTYTANLDKCIKKQRHHFANKGPKSQSYGFSGSHLRMWELDHKEGWVPKNWCFQTVVLEKTLENPTRNQCWIFTGRTETEAPIFWSPDAKSWLIGKDWWWERWKAEGDEGDRG